MLLGIFKDANGDNVPYTVGMVLETFGDQLVAWVECCW